jgi:uncharacterized protein YceH (UPF0502 family)
MPIPHKPGPAQSLALVGQIQPLPEIPADIQDRFESLQRWNDEMQRWWNRFGELFGRDMDSIATQFKTDETAAATSLAQVQNDIAAIKQQLAVLVTQVNALH